MASKLIAAIVAGAMMVAPTVAVAQDAQNDTASERSDLGNTAAIVGGTFLFIVILIAIWQGKGDDDGGTTPLPPVSA